MKIFYLLLLTLGATVSAFAQGFISFRNGGVTFRTQADRLVRDVNGNPLIGTNYRAQLYYGPLDTPAERLIAVANAPVRFRPPGTSSPGVWIEPGESPIRYFEGFVDVPLLLQVRVWDVAAGQTFEEAVLAGFTGTQFGLSAVFQSYAFNPVGWSPPDPPYPEEFRGFTLVPEPWPIVLGLLGIGGLTCRRKWFRGRE